MLGEGGIGIKVLVDAVPILVGAEEYAGMGLVPAGTYRNKEFYGPKVLGGEGLSPPLLDILYDAQTSGGLLIATPEADAESLLRRLQEVGVKAARIIAEVVAKPTGRLVLT